MKAQPDPPAHTVGGACQPPSKPGRFTPGIMWCCPTCKGLWYVGDNEWLYLWGSRQIWESGSSWKPPLVLPDEPTWGIAMVSGHSLPYTGKWVVEKDGAGTWLKDRQSGVSGITTSITGVTDFIPLSDEQIARIEAAR